jgi:D-inositol-3-phosphate glycosyltransferase
LPEQAHKTILAAADVFTSPADSVQETFGLTPVEAMACGIPQVVSDWSGYRDTVLDGRTGFLIPTWFPADDTVATQASGLYDGLDLRDHLLLGQATVVDIDALAGALQRLADDPDLRQRMAAESRRRAREKFDWRIIIRRYDQLWDELVEIASQLHGSPSRRTYATPSFRSAFAHYATAVLDQSTRLGLSDAGWRVLAGEEPLPAYLAQLDAISPSMAEAALHRAADLLPASFEALAEALDKGSAGRHHVMWLLKHGLLAVMVAERQPPTDRQALPVVATP